MDDSSMKDWASIAIAFFALVISALSVWLAYKRSGKAERVSIEALEAVKKANDIASESLFRLPLVTARLLTESHPINQDCEYEGIVLEIVNKSSIPISGAVIRVVPLSGFTYKADDYNDRVDGYPSESKKYSFSDVLLRNGAAHIDIAPFLFSVIKSNIENFKSKESVYNGAFNVVVAPMQEGRQVGVQTRQYGSKDYSIVNIQFVPEFIESLSIEDLLLKADRRIMIFSGWADDPWN